MSLWARIRQCILHGAVPLYLVVHLLLLIIGSFDTRWTFDVLIGVTHGGWLQLPMTCMGRKRRIRLSISFLHKK